MISDFGFNLIKSFEHLRTIPYADPIGIKTIGYGHVIDPGEKFTLITPTLAETILKQDCREVELQLESMIHVVISQWERDALISFIFNLGIGNFTSSHLRSLVNTNDKVAASHEFQRWVHAGGHVLPGLVRRRFIESILYLGASQEAINYFMGV